MVILSTFFLFIIMLQNRLLWGGTAVVTLFPNKAQYDLHFGFGAQISAAIKCVDFFFPILGE